MKINEIFYSLQGEGFHTGTPATFIRFSGCNLKCPFCDTDFKKYEELTEEQVVEKVKQNPSNLIVVTGGEPSLQLTYSFVDKLHHIGKIVAVETNGTKELPKNVDWVTISPKQAYVGQVGEVTLTKANEVKVVYDGVHPVQDYGIQADHYYIQPCDTGNKEQNEKITAMCVDFIKKTPKWKMSLQTQKILNVR